MNVLSLIETGSQSLPNSGPQREKLREKGQFWTPSWLAKVMAYWATEKQPETLFDPAVGPGTFFSAARQVGYGGSFRGFELHKSVINDSQYLGLTGVDFEGVVIGDFFSNQLKHFFPAIISNPPYIRHHRLSEERKAEIRGIAQRVLGFPLDGRVGLHLYFLLKCLEHLSPSGRLAFLLPSDVCEGVSSRALWNRLCECYHLEAVLTFDESAAPFPRVDTNAMVFFISNSTPTTHFKWLRVLERDADAIVEVLKGKCLAETVVCHERELSEALKTGLSRPPRATLSYGLPLSRFARVVRGIATGANEFFFLTHNQVKLLGLETRFFIRAIGRTRDCHENALVPSVLARLERVGRPTWLLNLDNTPKDRLPANLQSYLESGESRGINERALIKTRRPWYKMEHRKPPPILFAYLGRRDCRFILNNAGIVPLTGFLCVYPLNINNEGIKKLWRALNHPETIQNLMFAGKSYGGGAIKVEPRQLDDLEIPEHVLQEEGLIVENSPSQLKLWEKSKQCYKA